MFKYLKTYGDFLNEMQTLNQFAISPEILFNIKDLLNIEEDIILNSVDLKSKKNALSYLKSDMENNLFFAFKNTGNDGYIFFSDILHEKRYRLIAWKDNHIQFDGTDSIDKLFSMIPKGLDWFSAKNPNLWVDNDISSTKSIDVLEKWLIDFYTSFDVLLDEYYSEKKELFKNRITSIIKDFNNAGIETMIKDFKNIKVHKDDVALSAKYGSKDNIYHWLKLWIKKSYKEHLFNDSIPYIGMTLLKLQKKSNDRQLFKSFLLFLIQKVKVKKGV